MNNYEKVKAWKKRTKERIVQSFDNKCAVCGNKYPNEVYDLHHLDPKEKSFGLSNKHGICKSWNKIVVELRKCILVCSNCHRLIHNGLVDVPENAARFNENFLSYKITKIDDLEICPVCGKKTRLPYNITCSTACAAKKRSMIDWDSVDLLALYNEHKNYSKIGRMFGVSDSSIRKRLLRVILFCCEFFVFFVFMAGFGSCFFAYNKFSIESISAFLLLAVMATAAQYLIEFIAEATFRLKRFRKS